MSEASSPQQPITITLSKDEAEQLRTFISALPKLNELIKRLEPLASDGQLESLGMILSAAKSMKDSLNDEAVQSIATMAAKALELVSTLSHNSSERVLAALSENGEQLGQLPPPVNLRGCWGSRRIIIVKFDICSLIHTSGYIAENAPRISLLRPITLNIHRHIV